MDRWMGKAKEAGRKLRGAMKDGGFYVALTLCLMMVGGAAFFARSANQTPTPAPPQATVSPVVHTPTQVDRLANVAGPAEPAPIWPVSGREILKGQSDTEPQWSGALGQFELHTGVDILAAPGEAVLSVLPGTVNAAYSDPLLGYCVEVSHEGGYHSRYANLASLRMVSLGERVAEGQEIGAVGTSAAAESDLAPHLHYELYKAGAWALAGVEPASASHEEYEEHTP